MNSKSNRTHGSLFGFDMHKTENPQYSEDFWMTIQERFGAQGSLTSYLFSEINE